MAEAAVGTAVNQMAVHMANLYYFLTREMVETYGEGAKEVIRRAIIEFGHERGRRIAERVKADGGELTIENLDRYYDIPIEEGWSPQRTYENDQKHNVTSSCIMAEVWMERDWAEIGHIYCLIDIAIREGYSDNVEFRPLKNVLEGDADCQSLTVYKDPSKKGL